MDDATRRSLAQVVQEVESERTTADTLRELARNVDRSQRMIAMQLGQIYAMEASQVPGHVERTAHEFGEVRNAIAALAAEVPAQEYYKWSETWSWSVRHAVFGACLAYYLGTGRLLSKEEASTVLGMDRVPHDRMLLATDEYLHGLISMVNELPRLAMNAVTSGDFEAPVRIAAFVKQLHAAFQVLNLKNDILRKRFDGLKYDVKRVEEIIYDIRLRGLVSDQVAPAPAGDGSALLAIMQGRT
ncbi:Translin-1 [Malassezia japonica]|uniref:Translin-1 n=1 Tax=Malassezia japonica TaxID=223818 RepID=A0AAF0EV50_9BASI|nr:Translin-1 [Malassezia japonica]WFD37521.1 Translin-1 [Malassezia japonica]